MLEDFLLRWSAKQRYPEDFSQLQAELESKEDQILIYVCNCGGKEFNITPDKYLCPSCGISHIIADIQS